jgi:hypothetical protein
MKKMVEEEEEVASYDDPRKEGDAKLKVKTRRQAAYACIYPYVCVCVCVLREESDRAR